MEWSSAVSEGPASGYVLWANEASATTSGPRGSCRSGPGIVLNGNDPCSGVELGQTGRDPSAKESPTLLVPSHAALREMQIGPARDLEHARTLRRLVEDVLKHEGAEAGPDIPTWAASVRAEADRLDPLSDDRFLKVMAPATEMFEQSGDRPGTAEDPQEAPRAAQPSAPSHGFANRTPVPSKSRMLRVATPSPWASAVAAIRLSRAG